ncbi:MAG TPA: AbfB domain-containing protein [Thermoanaerobaculia bacterium]|nr:AbfB domain-containing protein [Thermoanaerobaculia bacterium]
MILALVLGASERDIVTQNVCISLEGRKLEDAKSELLLAARRGAVEQLFGSLVTSLTQVENLSLKKDQIQAASMGYLRVEGDPLFSNGQSLGELCVKIRAYATEEDRAKLRPKELSKKVCVAEGDVATIRKRAEEKATLEALLDFDLSLAKSPHESVRSLLHEVRFTEGGFVLETTTYCVKVTGVLYPVEAAALNLQNGGAADDNTRVVPGLRGEYFNIPPLQTGNLPSFPATRPEYVRIDKAIDFSWGEGAPAPRISADFFLVRWSGEFYAPVTGTYHFNSDHKSGMRLFIDDKPVLNDWKMEGAKEFVRAYGHFGADGDIYLKGEVWHRIEIEFFEETGNAFITLKWRPPGEALNVLPAASLRTVSREVGTKQPNSAEDVQSKSGQHQPAGVSLESKNYPSHYLRHQNFRAKLSTVSNSQSDLQDATFQLLPGLASGSDEGLISFRSVNHSSRFLRHRNYELWLDAQGTDNLSKNDSTFRIVPGLGGSGFFSFESLNYPGYYIRHRNSLFFIDKFDGTTLFRDDASFRVVEGLWNVTEQ